MPRASAGQSSISEPGEDDKLAVACIAAHPDDVRSASASRAGAVAAV